MAVVGECGRNGRDVDREPGGEHLIDLNALGAHQTGEHRSAVGPYIPLRPCVRLELCVAECRTAVRELGERGVRGLIYRAAVGAHIVAVDGKGPVGRLRLRGGGAIGAPLIDRETLAEDVKPVGVDARAVGGHGLHAVARYGASIVGPERAVESRTVAREAQGEERVEVHVVPVVPVGGVDVYLVGLQALLSAVRVIVIDAGEYALARRQRHSQRAAHKDGGPAAPLCHCPHGLLAGAPECGHYVKGHLAVAVGLVHLHAARAERCDAHIARGERVVAVHRRYAVADTLDMGHNTGALEVEVECAGGLVVGDILDGECALRDIAYEGRGVGYLILGERDAAVARRGDDIAATRCLVGAVCAADGQGVRARVGARYSVGHRGRIVVVVAAARRKAQRDRRQGDAEKEDGFSHY